MDTPTTSPTTHDRYVAAAEPLGAVVDRLTAEQWAAPSPCEGWTARDVLAHLIGAQRDFLTGRGIALGAGADVDADPAAAWHAHVAEVEPLVADPDVVSTEYDGHFGRTTIGDTLERFYVFDMVVHRWDVATAAGLDERLTDAELDQIETGAASFGDALYMEGVCAPGVQAPADADRQTRVLAVLGRRT